VDGDPYRRLAVAVIRRAVLDLDAPGLPRHVRWTAEQLLDGQSDACVTWATLAGVEPSAVARVLARPRGPVRPQEEIPCPVLMRPCTSS
jgi:hypothetical protein